MTETVEVQAEWNIRKRRLEIGHFLHDDDGEVKVKASATYITAENLQDPVYMVFFFNNYFKRMYDLFRQESNV